MKKAMGVCALAALTGFVSSCGLIFPGPADGIGYRFVGNFVGEYTPWLPGSGTPGTVRIVSQLVSTNPTSGTSGSYQFAGTATLGETTYRLSGFERYYRVRFQPQMPPSGGDGNLLASLSDDAGTVRYTLKMFRSYRSDSPEPPNPSVWASGPLFTGGEATGTAYASVTLRKQ